MSRVSIRNAPVALAALAVLVLPEAALAKRVCLQLDDGHEIVVTIPNLKKGEAYPVGGYYTESTGTAAFPVFGTLLVGATGAGALALEKGRTIVTSELGGAASAGVGPNTTITVEFSNMGGKLDVGVVGSGYENDTLRFFTVIDCADAQPVP